MSAIVYDSLSLDQVAHVSVKGILIMVIVIKTMS